MPNPAVPENLPEVENGREVPFPEVVDAELNEALAQTNDKAKEKAIKKIKEKAEVRIAANREEVVKIEGKKNKPWAKDKQLVQDAYQAEQEELGEEILALEVILQRIKRETIQNDGFTPEQIEEAMQAFKDGSASTATPEKQQEYAQILEYLYENFNKAGKTKPKWKFPWGRQEKSGKSEKPKKEHEPQYHTKDFPARIFDKVTQFGVILLADLATPEDKHWEGAKEAKERMDERGAFNDMVTDANDRRAGLSFRNADGFAVLYNKAKDYPTSLNQGERISLGSMLLLAQDLDVLPASADVSKITTVEYLDDAGLQLVTINKVLSTEKWNNQKKKDSLTGFFRNSQLDKLVSVAAAGPGPIEPPPVEPPAPDVDPAAAAAPGAGEPVAFARVDVEPTAPAAPLEETADNDEVLTRMGWTQDELNDAKAGPGVAAKRLRQAGDVRFTDRSTEQGYVLAALKGNPEQRNQAIDYINKHMLG